MSGYFNCDVLRDLRFWSFTRLMPIALLVAAGGLQTQALADQGCEDMRQLCKDATAQAAKCAKQEKGDASDCKPLVDVREATCAQVEIICKPPVGEPK